MICSYENDQVKMLEDGYNSRTSSEQFARLIAPMHSWGANCKSGATAIDSSRSDDKSGTTWVFVTKLRLSSLI